MAQTENQNFNKGHNPSLLDKKGKILTIQRLKGGDV